MRRPARLDSIKRRRRFRVLSVVDRATPRAMLKSMRLRRQKFGRDGPLGRPSARSAIAPYPDETSALDLYLPVWCVEEWGVAFYAQERYREAIEHLCALPFQTRRSRLYQIGHHMSLDVEWATIGFFNFRTPEDFSNPKLRRSAILSWDVRHFRASDLYLQAGFLSRRNAWGSGS
jgi:hypothetical protein